MMVEGDTELQGAAADDPYDAIVLAGGRGSRLGLVDKATLDVGDGPLLAGVLEAVADDARWDELSTLARERVRAYDERVVAGLWREALGLD